MTPTIRARAKVLISSPTLEKKKMVKTTTRVVKEVIKVRLSDWLILRLRISGKVALLRSP